MGVGNEMRQLRTNNKESQQQFSYELDVTRESVSAYETERARVPEDVAQKLTDKYNDPFVAFEGASKYYKWGPTKLNGEAVDLHRCSVAMKTEEELREALESIAAVQLSTNPSNIQAFEYQKLEKALHECMDAMTALTHFIAIICKEYGFSWVKMWTSHKIKLISKGFLRKEY